MATTEEPRGEEEVDGREAKLAELARLREEALNTGERARRRASA